MIGIGLSPLGAAVGAAGAPSLGPLPTDANRILAIAPGFTDATTLFEEVTGASATTAATTDETLVGTSKDVVGDRYLVSSTTGRRPTISISGGDTRLLFDGTDDNTRTATSDSTGVSLLSTASQTLTFFVGLEIPSDFSGDKMLLELGINGYTQSNSFYLVYYGATDDFEIMMRGTTPSGLKFNNSVGRSTPIALTMHLDVQGATRADAMKLRLNGAEEASTADVESASPAGTSFSNSHHLFVAARNLTTLNAKMALSALFVRTGLADGTLTGQYESWVAAKNGATLA